MFEKLQSWYLRNKAKRSLVKEYKYLIEVENLMESYVTRQILNAPGGSKDQWRSELMRHQNTIKARKDLVEFIHSVDAIDWKKKCRSLWYKVLDIYEDVIERF